MEVKDWSKRELEKIYVNVFILEEETYVKKAYQKCPVRAILLENKI